MRDPIRLWRRPDAIDWEGPGKYAPTLEVNKDTTYVVHSKDGQDGPRKYWGPRELVDFLGADRVINVLVTAYTAIHTEDETDQCKIGDAECMDPLFEALCDLTDTY